MAIVKEIITSQGALVRIHDDAYANISPEEMEKRIANFKEFAKKCFIEIELEKLDAK